MDIQEITKETMQVLKMVMYSETGKLYTDQDCELMVEEALRAWEFRK